MNVNRDAIPNTQYSTGTQQKMENRRKFGISNRTASLIIFTSLKWIGERQIEKWSLISFLCLSLTLWHKQIITDSKINHISLMCGGNNLEVGFPIYFRYHNFLMPLNLHHRHSSSLCSWFESTKCTFRPQLFVIHPTPFKNSFDDLF